MQNVAFHLHHVRFYSKKGGEYGIDMWVGISTLIRWRSKREVQEQEKYVERNGINYDEK